MEIKVVSGDIAHCAVDAIVVSLLEGVDKPSGATAAVDQAMGGAISQLIADGEIKGKASEVTTLHTLGRIESKRVAVLGLGKKDKLNPEVVRRGIAQACRHLRSTGAKKVASIALGAGEGGIAPESSAQAVAEGCLLGLYTFTQHRNLPPDEKQEIQEFWLMEREQGRIPALEQGVATGQIIARATMLARDLVNQPANYMTPAHLAQEAQNVAQAHGLSIQVWDREEMKGMGMGALLGVAQGSHNPPKFIILEYKGDDAHKPALGLIGKGITFDAGGISLKPAEGMGEMKSDMSGAAAVLGAMQALAQLKPKLNITALIPATENLPGGGALKPGDVLRALNNKTIEIISTDAEGRLILADALSYAQKLNLSPLVDLATLTGACRIALGDGYSGAFTNNQDLLNQVVEAGKAVGEEHWPMPLAEAYKEQLKSDVADMKNAGARWGGAITAALFLAEFAGTTPWVHLDIAGTAFNDREKGYIIKGATGVGVRTLVSLALILAEKEGG